MGAKRQVSVHIEHWPMRAPFRITGHLFTALDCLIVEIAEGPHVGRGEAAGVYYLDDTPNRAFESVQSIRAALEEFVATRKSSMPDEWY